jgi:acetyl esterase/lipase
MIEYRLAPEHPFPAAFDDTMTAWRWLMEQGYAPGRVVVAGDSAGGALALALGIALCDAGQPQPAALVGMSAYVDISLTVEELRERRGCEPPGIEAALRKMFEAYYAGTDPRHPLISPALADLRGLPPMLLQTGSEEITRKDNERCAESARAAGVDVTLEVWPGMFHVWQLLTPILPEAREAVARIGGFARARWQE